MHPEGERGSNLFCLVLSILSGVLEISLLGDLGSTITTLWFSIFSGVLEISLLGDLGSTTFLSVLTGV